MGKQYDGITIGEFLDAYVEKDISNKKRMNEEDFDLYVNNLNCYQEMGVDYDYFKLLIQKTPYRKRDETRYTIFLGVMSFLTDKPQEKTMKELFFEYGITQSQIAEDTEICPKTLSRFFNGECRLKKEEKRDIYSCLYKRTHYRRLEIYNRQEFAELLDRLLVHFLHEINVETLAKKVGISEVEISKYRRGEKFAEGEIQGRILKEFVVLCSLPSLANDKEFRAEMQCKLRDYLYLEEVEYTDELSEFDYDDDAADDFAVEEELQYEELEELLSGFHTLKVEIQSIVVEHFYAFCDRYAIMESEINTGEISNYYTTRSFVERLRSVDKEKMEQIVSTLEKSAPNEFGKNAYLRGDFQRTTEFRKMILIREKNPKLFQSIYREFVDEEQLSKAERINVQKLTEIYLHSNEIFCQIEWEEIEFKLQLSAHEWYVWMLLSLCGHAECKRIFEEAL